MASFQTCQHIKIKDKLDFNFERYRTAAQRKSVSFKKVFGSAAKIDPKKGKFKILVWKAGFSLLRLETSGN
jgi:hypothetical protein